MIIIRITDCVAVGMFAVILVPTAPAAGMLPPDKCQPHPKKFLNQLWYFRCKITRTFRFG